MEGDLFENYFRLPLKLPRVPRVRFSGRTFPVATKFLEDALELTSHEVCGGGWGLLLLLLLLLLLRLLLLLLLLLPLLLLLLLRSKYPTRAIESHSIGSALR